MFEQGSTCPGWLKGAFTALAFASWTRAASYSIHAGMRPNPITLPGEDADAARVFMPQGWRFFTKHAEEANPAVFVRVGPEWLPAFRESPYSIRYLFGANRTGRYRGVEIGLLEAAVAKSAWTNCAHDPVTCLSALQPRNIRTVKERPTLCGELGLVQQPPIPWAWARSSRPVIMPSKVARVVVPC